METHDWEIKRRMTNIPTETAEPCLEIHRHFEKVIIDDFVDNFNLSLDFVTWQQGS